jgi:hypothetical protein
MLATSCRSAALRRISGGLLLGLLLAPALQAQMPIQPLLPESVIAGGSLARNYQLALHEKAGDINKTHIRVLAILNEAGEPVGLKVAGHSEEEICQQTSQVVAQLAQSIDNKGAEFGGIQDQEQPGYYISYGLFEGPVGRKYRKPYQEALQQIRGLARRHPGKVQISEIRQEQYRAIQDRMAFYTAYAREQDTSMIIVHMLPENYLSFTPNQALGRKQYQPFLQQVQKTADEKYAKRLRDDKQALTQLQQQMGTLELLYGYQFFFDRYSQRRWQQEDSLEQQERLRGVLNEAFSTTESQKQLRENRQTIQRLRTTAQRLNDPYLQQILQRWAQRVSDLQSPDSLKAGIHAKLIEQEDSAQRMIDSMAVRWRPLQQDPIRQLLEKYLVNQKTFLEYERLLDEQHPHMLADAVMRGWPVFSVEQYQQLYKQGYDRRRNAQAFSHYQFFAPQPHGGGAQVYTVLSGIVLQIVHRNKTSFLNLEEFMENEAKVPPLYRVIASLASGRGLLAQSSAVAINRNYPVGGAKDTAQLPAFRLARRYLDSQPIGWLSNDFIKMHPDSQIQRLAGWRDGATIAHAGYNAQHEPRLRYGDALLTVSDRSPFEPEARSLLHHALRRYSRDPRLTAPLAYPLHIPLHRPVQRSGDSWLSTTELALPAQARPLPAVLAKHPSRRKAFARHYQQLMLRLARRAGDLPGVELSESPKNRFETTLAAHRKLLSQHYGPAPQGWPRAPQDYYSFLQDLVRFMESRVETQRNVFQYAPAPGTLYLGPDSSWYPTDFSAGRRTHYAVHWVQTLARSLLLRYGSDQPLKPAQLKRAYEAHLDWALYNDYMGERETETPHFRAGLVYGMLELGAQLQRRRQKLHGDSEHAQALDRRLRNVYQPLLYYLIDERGDLPDELDFILRNLKSAQQAMELPVFLG